MRTVRSIFAVAALAAALTSSSGTAALAASEMHNPDIALDVDANRLVQPQDAVLIINLLIRAGSTPEMTPLDLTALAGTETTYFYDTSNDSDITPFDALLVINHLILAPEPSSMRLAMLAAAAAVAFAWRRRRVLLAAQGHAC